jgi:hypothetical protein
MEKRASNCCSCMHTKKESAKWSEKIFCVYVVFPLDLKMINRHF